MVSWVQAVLLGLMSCYAVFTITCLGTTIGDYTLNRPLIASVLIGLVLGGVKGYIQIVVPMQIIYIALIAPGGITATDLCAVSHIGILLAWAPTKSQGFDLDGFEASGLTGALNVMAGTIGTVQLYGTAMMNLVQQYIEWARLDKKDFSIVGGVEVILPPIPYLLIFFTPVVLIVYCDVDAIDQFKGTLLMDSWYMKSLFTLGSLLPAVGIAIPLKSVANRAIDLIFLLFGLVLAGSMYLTLIAATTVDAVLALINYQTAMIGNRAATGPAGIDDDGKGI